MHKEVCIVYIPNLSEKKLSTIETIYILLFCMNYSHTYF